MSTSTQQQQLQERMRESLTGKIMYVPPKNRIIARWKPDLDTEGYDHPAVILSSKPDGLGRVNIAMLRSFGDRPVAESFPREEDCDDFLPIDGAVHPNNKVRRLFLRRGIHAPLHKRSFVDVRAKHTISYSALKPYRHAAHLPPWLNDGAAKYLQTRLGESTIDDVDNDRDDMTRQPALGDEPAPVPTQSPSLLSTPAPDGCTPVPITTSSSTQLVSDLTTISSRCSSSPSSECSTHLTDEEASLPEMNDDAESMSLPIPTSHTEIEPLVPRTAALHYYFAPIRERDSHLYWVIFVGVAILVFVAKTLLARDFI